MNDPNSSPSRNRVSRRSEQQEQLRAREAELGRLAKEAKREEFFQQVAPVLGPLKDYIKRQLRVAYLNLQLRTEAPFTSADILDEVILTAYEIFDKKPQGLSLEQWLYQLASRKLENYLSRASKRDVRRRSLESLAEKEVGTLEERMTTDAEGEVMLEQDLYDTEYNLQPEFTPPAYQSDPSELVEREDELRQIVRALSRVPEKERTIFELYAVEGFSKDEVAKIADVSPEMVPEIVEQVRAEVRRALQGGSKEAA
jgi:RNA polymerase sigma factor (sigma-70 family)